MNNERFTIAVSGGATGGHVIPAINICREIRKRNPDINIIYIGTGGSLEERLAIQEGYQFKKVKMAYLRRSLSLKNFILPFIALTAVLQAIVYLEVYKARFVIGTGGYSALPALAAAWALGIPYVLQEQNAFPGLVTRIMSREARRIYVGYGEVADHIRTNPDKIIETGNPVWCESLKMSKETVREQFGLIQNRK